MTHSDGASIVLIALPFGPPSVGLATGMGAIVQGSMRRIRIVGG